MITPEKQKCYTIYNQALDKGILQRRPCEVCGAVYTEGHHADYSKPLQVKWLCLVHHRAEHRRLGWGLGGAPKGSKGAWLGKKLSPKHRDNLSKARRKRGPISEETRRKLSESHKGLIRTSEHRKNLSASLRIVYAKKRSGSQK